MLRVRLGIVFRLFASIGRHDLVGRADKMALADEWAIRYAAPLNGTPHVMRERKTSSSYFACFTAMLLVVQLVLACGHVHFAGSQVDHAQAVPLTETRDSSPGKQHPERIGFCPLCWVQAAAGSLLLPVAMVVPHPLQIGCYEFTALGHVAELIPPAAFKARGPPLASEHSGT